jgi:hypothetical protein
MVASRSNEWELTRAQFERVVRALREEE